MARNPDKGTGDNSKDRQQQTHGLMRGIKRDVEKANQDKSNTPKDRGRGR